MIRARKISLPPIRLDVDTHAALVRLAEADNRHRDLNRAQGDRGVRRPPRPVWFRAGRLALDEEEIACERWDQVALNMLKTRLAPLGWSERDEYGYFKGEL